jgi:hypothetical protein
MVEDSLSKIDLECCSLIKSFLAHETSGDSFCGTIATLWMSHRDIQESIKKTWDEPYDKQLVKARLRGELTAEEFGKLYSELLGLGKMTKFSKMINEAHSVCSVFSPSPEDEWEIDEEQLQSEIQILFTNYQQTCNL